MIPPDEGTAPGPSAVAQDGAETVPAAPRPVPDSAMAASIAAAARAYAGRAAVAVSGRGAAETAAGSSAAPIQANAGSPLGTASAGASAVGQATTAAGAGVAGSGTPAANFTAGWTTPGAVRAQVIEQLVRQDAASLARGKVTLRLDPPHLGRVEVEVQRQGDRLTVVFRPETADAERALRSGTGDLASALAARGGRWNDVQVRVDGRQEGGEGGGGSRDESGDDRGSGDRRGRRDPRDQE